ncbi:MAG: hypothetical protein OHK0052_23350 [Anaerolineales bacterium]
MSNKSAVGAAARDDVRALWGGIAFSFLFTLLIWVLGARLNEITLLPDTGAAWYYWKLPQPTFWTRFTAWGLYLAHQVSLWYLIYRAQREGTRYTTGLHAMNRWALGVNALFIFLHLIQSHIWYDGLAQDVSVFSSQASVIVLLVWVILMENNRRGVFWGKKMPFSKAAIAFARKYHGYYFAWATIYTFWFHPMVNTPGHLIGFFYMFLLLLQGSLFFTRIHLNRWWMLTQEFLVLLHGALVAVMSANGLWQMFAFGFASMFIVTQMHGLGWSLRTRLLWLGAYVAAIVAVYSQVGFSKVHQVTWIPVVEYAGVFVLAGLFWVLLWGWGLIRGKGAVMSDK